MMTSLQESKELADLLDREAAMLDLGIDELTDEQLVEWRIQDRLSRRQAPERSENPSRLRPVRC